jgi:hypothetical protein
MVQTKSQSRQTRVTLPACSPICRVSMDSHAGQRTGKDRNIEVGIVVARRCGRTDLLRAGVDGVDG